MAKVALVTFGSAGDVHPMLALGSHLRCGGHEVVLVTNPFFAADAEKAGLRLLPVGTVEQHRQTAAHPKLWDPIDGFGVMWRYLLRPALLPTYHALEELSRDERWLVLASPVAMGARVAQEKLGLPLVSVYTAATMLRSVCNPMTLAQWRIPDWTPTPVRRLAWQLLDQHKLQPLVLPDVHRLRLELALPPIASSVVGQWMHSPLAGMALFPDWFASAPDWPPQVAKTGFALYDEEGPAPGPGVSAFPDELQLFLAAGAAPLVFMAGTASQGDTSFYQAAVQACTQTGERGLLLGTLPSEWISTLPSSIHVQPYVAFGPLLPKARALVHHGGIGTCAQALRAGIPQLIVPRAYDQFDNAMRLENLGVGRTLKRHALTRMGAELERLLRDPTVAAACRRWAAQTNAAAARTAVSQLVERWAQ